MNNYNKISENEINLDMSKVIMSKTNFKGVIQYVNNYFMEVSGYTEEELIGKPHNIIRHPDMPKVIFKIMWERLLKGESIYAAVKNLTKNGDFYWVLTKFETTFDKDGNITAHYARRKALPLEIRVVFESLYKTIIAIEKHDIKLAEETFLEVINDSGLTYDELILEIVEMNNQELKDYFQSTSFNSNTNNEDTIAEIDFNQIEKIKKSNNSGSRLYKSIDELETLIIELKNNIDPKKEHKGFLGNIFDDLKKELGSDLQIKNPLK